MSKKKKTKNAIDILRNDLFHDDPQLEAELEEIREEAKIAREIFYLRTAAGLSQAELAKMIGTQRSAISRLEDADYDGHSLSMLRKIAKALNKRIEVRFVPIEGIKAA